MPVIDHARTAQPAEYRSDNHNKWSHPNRLYQRHLEIYLDRMFDYLTMTGAERVLDAGCGEGIVYRAMRERGWRGQWTGFDFSGGAVRFAGNASSDASWVHGSAYHIPFADKSFDLVFSSQVLEHLPNPEGPLAEYRRVTSKWLLLSVPLEPYFRALTWLSVRFGIGGDPGHVNHWAPAAFRRFARRSGRIHTWDWTTIYQIALIDVEE